MTQMVKNLPAMQETRFDLWVGKIPWREHETRWEFTYRTMQLCKLNEYTIWRQHNIQMETLNLKSPSNHLKMHVSTD